MLTIIARLFKDNQLVGYRLSDGQREQDFTKQQAWLYAKNKQILNVVATGTQEDPGLSGTNGFELKKLPEVKWGTRTDETQRSLKYTTQDLTAALIRDVLSNGIPNVDTDKVVYAKQCMRKDVDNFVVNYSNVRTLSDSLLVENTLCDSTKRGGSILVGQLKLTPEEEQEIHKYKLMYTCLTILIDVCKIYFNETNTTETRTIDILDNSELIVEAFKKSDYFNDLRVTIKNLDDLLNNIKSLSKELGIKPIDLDTSMKLDITQSEIMEIEETLKELKELINTALIPKRGLMPTSPIIGYDIR